MLGGFSGLLTQCCAEAAAGLRFHSGAGREERIARSGVVLPRGQVERRAPCAGVGGFQRGAAGRQGAAGLGLAVDRRVVERRPLRLAAPRLKGTRPEVIRAIGAQGAHYHTVIRGD